MQTARAPLTLSLLSPVHREVRFLNLRSARDLETRPSTKNLRNLTAIAELLHVWA